MSLELIKRKSGMNTLYWRLKYSLDEIQEKHPERLDIIAPMEESIAKKQKIINDYAEDVEKKVSKAMRFNSGGRVIRKRIMEDDEEWIE